MSHRREPIEQTCPEIDKIIECINKACDCIRGYEKIDDSEDLKEIIGYIEYQIWGLDDKMEDLRRSNDILRSWGRCEAERVDELEIELTLNEKVT